MPEPASLLAFVIASLAVLLMPGPGVMYLVARSLGQGRKAGLISVAGLATGALVHVAAAVAGVSAVLLASATAFSVVKLLGAAYLVYLGLRLLRRRPATTDVAVAAAPAPLRRVFTDGVLVSVLNPKIAMFFLAFLPQFVNPAAGPVTQQLLLLGLLYVALSLCTDGAYALAAGSLAQRLRGRFRGPLPRYAGGLVFIGLGVGTAIGDRR